MLWFCFLKEWFKFFIKGIDLFNLNIRVYYFVVGFDYLWKERII